MRLILGLLMVLATTPTWAETCTVQGVAPRVLLPSEQEGQFVLVDGHRFQIPLAEGVLLAPGSTIWLFPGKKAIGLQEIDKLTEEDEYPVSVIYKKIFGLETLSDADKTMFQGLRSANCGTEMGLYTLPQGQPAVVSTRGDWVQAIVFASENRIYMLDFRYFSVPEIEKVLGTFSTKKKR